MAFTAVDFHDLIRLLSENPQWRAELRRLVLTDEFLELPALVRRMAEWQQAMAEEQRALAAAQARTEKRLEELAEGQRTLFEAQARTEQILQELSESHAGLKQEFNRFRDVFGATVEDEAGGVLASVLREKGYRLLAESYFSPARASASRPRA